MKTIKGDFPAELCTQLGYNALLQCHGIECVKDPDGHHIYSFDALEDDVAYTAGPAIKKVAFEKFAEHPLEEQEALDGKVKVVPVAQKTLAGFSQDSLVFVNQQTKACWEALEDAFQTKHHLTLNGPPATGKSTTAWAWALWKARQQRTTVTWFHYDKRRGDIKVVIDGANERIFTGGNPDQSTVNEAQGTILIVDGATLDETTDLSRQCTAWHAQRGETGMFVLVFAQAPFVSYHIDLQYRIRTHVVNSWTQSEYLLACEDPKIFDAVEAALECPNFHYLVRPDNKEEKNLGPTLDKSARIAGLVAAKFYYAGGNVRWMLEMTFDAWQIDVDSCLAKVSKYDAIFWSDDKSANHLRGSTNEKKNVGFFMSQYVAKQLAEKCATKKKRNFILHCYSRAAETKNPIFWDWIFERDVEYQLEAAFQAQSPVRVWVEGKEEYWKIPRYISFANIATLIPEVKAMADGGVLWAKPTCSSPFDFLRFVKVGSETNLHVLSATSADRKIDLLLYGVNVLASHLSIERIRLEFVTPHGKPKVQIGNVVGDLVGWKSMKNVDWPSSFSGSNSFAGEFVVQVEIDCTSAAAVADDVDDDD